MFGYIMVKLPKWVSILFQMYIKKVFGGPKYKWSTCI